MIADTISESASGINAVQTETSLVVHDGWIYVAYVDAEQRAVVAKRAIGGSLWISAVVGTGVAFDSHNGAAIGIDPDGHIHVAFDLHSVPLAGRYYMSTAPGGLDFLPGPMIPADIPAIAVSYPRFYRAGSQFYMLFRDGGPTAGDVYLIQWRSAGEGNGEGGNGGWVSGRMLISGIAFGAGSYLGSCVGIDGDLLIIWTYRFGAYNRGVYAARYQADGTCRYPDGSLVSLPLTPAESDLSGDGFAETISNVSLSIGSESGGTLHAAFTRYHDGYREVFHAVRAPGIDSGWTVRQVTTVRAPVLDACPVPIPGDHPRPCHMQIQGPAMILYPEGCVELYWVRSTALSVGSWVRPPGILYVSRSGDRGRTWHTSEVKRDVSLLLGEMPRESGGLPYLLAQTLTSAAGRLEILECRSALAGVSVAGSVRANLSGGSYIEMGSAPIATPEGFGISAWVRPEAVAKDMCVIDRGGPSGQRELRLMLWAGLGSVYNPDRVQVLVGDSAGKWGLVWYPEVSILPGVVSHIAVSFDGAVVHLYLGGQLVSAAPYAATVLPSVSRTLVGACRNTSGLPERMFEGELAVEWFRHSLTVEAVEELADCPLI